MAFRAGWLPCGGQPRETIRRGCDLAGIPDENVGHPTPLMMREMLELARRVTTVLVVSGPAFM